MKGVFVIIDGVADEPCVVLGEKTPLEIAKTTNLDWFSARGRVDYCYPVKEGFAPESSEGVLSLLGYEPFSVKRGVLEAIGLGVQLKKGDLAFRCNFATIDTTEDRNVIDRRAGRTLTTEEAKKLGTAINESVKLPFNFEFYPAVQHRGVLVIRGKFSDKITGVEAEGAKLEFSKPLDETRNSKFASDLLNLFVRKSFDILERHPVNMERARKGLFPANVLLCRGAGNEKLKLKKLPGKWMGLGYMPLEKGIIRASGMDIYEFSYPRLKRIDVYENLYDGLWMAVKYAVKMLKWNKNKYDYFYIHFKETDIPGHDNKPLDKVKMINILDGEFFSFLRRFIGEGRLVVTADHMTSCKKKAHTGKSVPVLSYPFFWKGAREAQRFTEACGLEGKKILGKKLLKERLFKR